MPAIQRFQGFKFELRPNGEQIRQMRSFAGACRFVYNRALAKQEERYANGQKKLSYAELCRVLTGWRKDPKTKWLADVPVHPLQQALRDLTGAYANYFAKRTGPPRFKKKGRGDSFRYPDPKRIKLDQVNARIFLPRIGWVRYRKSREVPGEVRSVTVSGECGKWFISVQTRRTVERPEPRTGRVVGIDMGIVNFVTLAVAPDTSAGLDNVTEATDKLFCTPLNSFKRHADRLRRAQQAMSRKVKFSRNWRKAKEKVQRIYARIAHVRRDFLHKLSTTICKNHAIVCIENLQVSNLSRSAAGTPDAPGKNVRAKSSLNRSILDQGWYEFRRQLEYKLAWNGGRLMVVPARHTSRTCPRCGHVSEANRPTRERFHCESCGFQAHADVVGAINILSRGMQIMRDEGRDTTDASVGMPACAGVSPDGLWIEPHQRSEAGTHRSDTQEKRRNTA